MWWSRLAQPNLHTWTDDKPLRLLQNEPDRQDREPKAVACYGLLRTDTQGMLLRFVDGRPVSAVTTQFLAWLTNLPLPFSRIPLNIKRLVHFTHPDVVM